MTRARADVLVVAAPTRSTRHVRLRLTPTAALVGLAAAACLLAVGCGTSPAPSAVSFVKERKTNARRTQQAVDEARAALAALSEPPTVAQLLRLRSSARIARERVNEVRVGLPTFEAAEEEVPIAESEAGTGSNELNYAMGELVRYARHPRPVTLARYRAYETRGVERWNESMRELWRLAREPNPPLL
jgi:hypothetical protein